MEAAELGIVSSENKVNSAKPQHDRSTPSRNLDPKP